MCCLQNLALCVHLVLLEKIGVKREKRKTQSGVKRVSARQSVVVGGFERKTRRKILTEDLKY